VSQSSPVKRDRADVSLPPPTGQAILIFVTRPSKSSLTSSVCRLSSWWRTPIWELWRKYHAKPKSCNVTATTTLDLFLPHRKPRNLQPQIICNKGGQGTFFALNHSLLLLHNLGFELPNAPQKRQQHPALKGFASTSPRFTFFRLCYLYRQRSDVPMAADHEQADSSTLRTLVSP